MIPDTDLRRTPATTKSDVSDQVRMYRSPIARRVAIPTPIGCGDLAHGCLLAARGLACGRAQALFLVGRQVHYLASVIDQDRGSRGRRRRSYSSPDASLFRWLVSTVGRDGVISHAATAPQSSPSPAIFSPHADKKPVSILADATKQLRCRSKNRSAPLIAATSRMRGASPNLAIIPDRMWRDGTPFQEEPAAR